jgi:hypothetical protein
MTSSGLLTRSSARPKDSPWRSPAPAPGSTSSPAKWDFYAMDAYRLAGDDALAVPYAHEILRSGTRPDGSEIAPSRWPAQEDSARLAGAYR